VARLPYVNEEQFEVVATYDKTTANIFKKKDGSATFARAIIRRREEVEQAPPREERTPMLFSGKEEQ